ncbi:hypothetical protein ACQ856_18200 [Mycolicibacterium psychrotolerans]|uniref:hypothetical protein n=1 Tax=Mycolicibacterium psychrotolerans TaxID=216929 RepID=UPI003D66E2F8
MSVADEWQPTPWFRVVLSDGSVWCESSDEQENRAALKEIRTRGVIVYPPRHPDGKLFGPDAGAKLERLYERPGRRWQAVVASTTAVFQ